MPEYTNNTPHGSFKKFCTHLQLELLGLFVGQRDDGYLGDLVDFVAAW